MDKAKVALIGLALAGALVVFGCTQQEGSYTLADVAQHSTPQDCWIARDGNVYNITSMVSASPNTPFAQACGTDVTQVFPNGGQQGADFNSFRRDFNGPRPDFNSLGAGASGAPRDFNGPRPDFNAPRAGAGGSRQGKGFSQYYIGRLVG